MKLLKLSKFINEVVAKRKIPNLNPEIHGEPKVLMKMDIEGSEVEVLPDLLYEKSLLHINGFLAEFHEDLTTDMKRKNATVILKSLINNYAKFMYLTSGHLLRTSGMDDETYFDSNYPLPQC